MKAFSFGGKKPTAKKALPAAVFGGDDDDSRQQRRPAPTSLDAPAPADNAPTAPTADDDVDPLDAFMLTNAKKGAEADAKREAARADTSKSVVDRFADEEDDLETDYYIALEKKKAQLAVQVATRAALRAGAAPVCSPTHCLFPVTPGDAGQVGR